jgi:hypothetical protein
VMLLRIKKFKLDVKRKVWIICDRDDRLRNARDEKRRHIISRCIKCFFSLIAKRMNDNDDSWLLKVINDQHNHEAIIVDFHSTQRKITMIAEIWNDISRQLQVQTKSSQILSNFRILDFIIFSNLDDSKNSRINSLFKSRDIYNLKAKLRRESLKSFTSIQALIRELKQEDWTYAMQKKRRNLHHSSFFR